MKNTFIAFLTALVSFPFLAAPVAADPLSDAFCPELQNEDLYDQKNLDNYKVLIPGKDGWVFRTKVDFKSNFGVNETTVHYIKQLQDTLKERGSELVIVMPPPRGIIHSNMILPADAEKYAFTKPEAALKSYKKTITALEKADINVIGAKDIEPGQSFYYKRDHHWNPDGAKLMAQKTAAFVKELPGFDSLPKTTFATHSLGAKDYTGAFEKAFRKVCDTQMPSERSEKYSTEKTVSDSDSSALFGSGEVGVVLLGTSNSAPDPNVANFDGFLKEALGTDVQNLAINGAGADTSLISYLNSAEFKTKPAKIILWEIPGYYDLDHMTSKIFLQAIPAVYGECGDKSIKSVKNVSLTPGEAVTVLDNLSEDDIRGEEYYVHLKFSKPVTSAFNMRLAYEGRNPRGVQKFDRSDRYPKPDGDYYFLLSDENAGSLRQLMLDVPKGLKGVKVAASICKIAQK